DPGALKAAPAQAHLREILNPIVSKQENVGDTILDSGGLILARPVDARIGERLVLGVADAASKAMAGQRAFLPATLRQHFSTDPMAFLLVPIRDSSESVIAALAFRMRPEQMGAILNASRLGESGETYAVDADGHMVTDT